MKFVLTLVESNNTTRYLNLISLRWPLVLGEPSGRAER